VKTKASLNKNSGSGRVRWKATVRKWSSTAIPSVSVQAAGPQRDAPTMAANWLVIGDESR
jgi:hypothetical protein